jgi:hypothetical protein
VSSGAVSRLNQRIYAQIETWRTKPIEGSHPHVFLDGLVLRRSWAGEVRHVSVLVAIGIGIDGCRYILGLAEGDREDRAGWLGFLRHLKDRGLTGVQLTISDACVGLVDAVAEVVSEARWQRCVLHWYRNVFSQVPNGKVADVARVLKAIHAQEDCTAALAKAKEVATKLEKMKLGKAATLVQETVDDTLTHCAFPSTHWRQIRTNNPKERIVREIRRRTRVVGALPDGQSALMRVAAPLWHVAAMRCGSRRYLAAELLSTDEAEQYANYAVLGLLFLNRAPYMSSSSSISPSIVFMAGIPPRSLLSRPPSSITRRSCRARSLESPTSKQRPFTSCVINSFMLSRFETITGVSAAKASWITRGKSGHSEGTTRTSISEKTVALRSCA